MAKPLIIGFVCGAATPVAVACIAAIFFLGGNITTIPLAVLMGVVFAAPVSVAFTVLLGIPFYFAYQRLRINSLRAYLVTGFGLALPVAAYLLWEEYSGGYENANQALLAHTSQLVSLISGPAATATFWWVVRPDLDGNAWELERSKPAIKISTFGYLGLAACVLAWVTFSVFHSLRAPKDSSLTPLATAEYPFDANKTPALVQSLREYASPNEAQFYYYFMPVAAGRVLLMATLEFPGAIHITVTNAGVVSSPNASLEAMIYSNNNKASQRSTELWTNFVSFLRPAVDGANATPAPQLPKVAESGEGGKIERKWWDWRFHR